MKFTINKKIIETYSGVTVGVIVIRGMDNHGHNTEILALLRKQETEIASRLKDSDLSMLPEINEWREIYKTFGSNPKEFRSSIEALLRRAQAAKPLPQINNLVDLYNYLSLKYAIPAGAEDLDKVKGNISLTFSNGTEKGIYLGSTTVEACYSGEVIYKDDDGFICRRWNWREADRTKIDMETANAVLVFEKTPGVSINKLSGAIEEAKKILEANFHASCEVFLIENARNSFSVDFQTGKKASSIHFEEKISGKQAQKQQKKEVHEILYTLGSVKGSMQQLLMRSIASLGVTGVTPQISVPENPMHGDYSTNVAMLLAKTLKKSPVKIADELKNAIIKDQTISDAGIIERAEVAGPGFLNIYLSEASLINQVSEVLKIKDVYGSALKMAKIGSQRSEIEANEAKKTEQKQSQKGVKKSQAATISPIAQKPLKNPRKTDAVNNAARQNALSVIRVKPELIPEPRRKRVMVEFTDPNPFKELHIGHLYSNAVGESLSRLYEAQGWEVKRADYFGDVGMHVAKSIWGMGKLLEDEKRLLSDIEPLSLTERMHWLGRAYALGAAAYEGETATESAKKDIQQFNLLVYVAAQDYMATTYHWTPVVDYRGLLPKSALTRLPAVRALFEKGREWSMAYFESIFARLGTKFDYYYPESIVGEYGAGIVKDHPDVFTKSDGAIIFDGEKIGLHTRVFVNSMGLPTYETKELGLNDKKYRDFPFDLSLIVTGKEINEYFRVLMAAMVQVIPDVAARTHHIGHGMVRLPQGKMSSRTGKVITAEWLLDEAKKSIYKILDESASSSPRSPLSPREKDEIAEKAAIASIKYSFLRVNISSDIAFDLEASVSFEGDSGPYLQYTYARCKSVLRKASARSKKIQSLALNLEERNLARSIMQFPDVVFDAAQNFSPNTICTYLFHLAQEFNVFYAKHPIIGNDMRLALTAATAQVLKNGLYLLGIDVLEKM